MFVSEDGKSYAFWQTITLLKISGEQRMKVKQIDDHINFIRFVIKKNFGEKVTYLNNLKLYSMKADRFSNTSKCKFKR